ncbi:MAG TPA: hypothetical protein VJ739_20075 [Gemmataceae bacterium]|nr:hypothetical protein [Gemmataceae bacterium]
MAKAKGGRPNNDESVSGYFRKVFQENPKLLKSRSNAEVLERWLKDHPGTTEVPKNVKQSLSNVKSIVRGKRRRRLRREDAERPAGEAPPTRRASKGLEEIETMIDDTMSLAKALDRDGLSEVIQLLRQARNAVVWKQGE